MKEICKKNRDYFWLLGIVGITVLIVYSKFIFGKNVFVYCDIGQDTLDSYLMYYNLFVNKIRDGFTTFYDLRMGMGGNLFTVQMYLFDPFSVIIIACGLLFSNEAIGYALIWANILKIISSSIITYRLLKELKISSKSAVLFAYLYSCSAFMIVWGQHYFMATFCVLLPLILLYAEKSIGNKNNYVKLALILAISFIFSIYFSYMAILVMIVWVFARYTIINSNIMWKDVKKDILYLMGTIITGGGLAAIVLIPSAYQMLCNSARLESDVSVWERFLSNICTLYPSDYYLQLNASFFSYNLNGVGSGYEGYGNYYECLSIGLTGLIVFLLLQYLFLLIIEEKSKKRKLVNLFMLGVLLILLLAPIGSMILNGMAKPFSRHGFIVNLMLVIMCAECLDTIYKQKRISYVGTGISAAFAAIVLGKSIFESYTWSVSSQNRYLILIVSCICLLMFSIYCICFVLFVKNRLSTSALYCLILIISICNITSDSYLAVNQRDYLVKECYVKLFDEDLIDIIQNINKESEFYRVEKIYYSIGSLQEGYAQNYYGITCYNSLLNKYLVEYKDKMLQSSNVDTMYRFYEFDKEQLEMVGLKYILSDTVLGYDYMELVKCVDDIYIYKMENEPEVGSFYTEIITEANVEKIDNNYERSVLLNRSICINDVDIPDICDEMGNSDIEVYKSESQNEVSARVNNEQCGYFFLAVPYEKGWRAYVDGEEVNIYRANYGFMAVYLEPGMHNVRFTYHTPGFFLGMIISMVSLGGYILYVIKENKSIKRSVKK